MIRSLQWRLQLWHALLLTTVLVMFGAVVYALQWQTRLQNADAELDRVASVLTSRLRGLFPVPRMQGPGQWPPRNPTRGPNPRQGDEELPNAADALAPSNVPPARDAAFAARDSRSRGGLEDRSREGNRTPPPDNPRGIGLPPVDDTRPREPARDGPEDRPREGNRQSPDDPRSRDSSREPSGRNSRFAPPPGLGLPDEFKHLFEADDDKSFYFLIWDRNGVLLEKSKAVDDIPFPDLHSKEGLPVRQARMRDLLHREVVHVSRFDINVLVGRSIQPDLASLHRSGMLLILTGLGVLVIGLAGGWWFSSRAIRPIAEMSAIAETISVTNLSRRINVSSTATELEQLATVLNHTFDRLQSAFERQGQFTADASHELRTPLAVILSQAELALSRPRSGEEYQKALQACRRASLRMKSLIDALLLLARFDSGQPDLERSRVELDCIARDAVEMLQPLADERGVQLKCTADEVTIEADYNRLFQLVTNLLSNAIRYNRTDGSVEILVHTDDKSAIIRITDTGVGIPPADLPKIFDRFYRVDKARSQAEGGCGLGLAICRKIVEAHQGSIAATSEPGVGTTVEVRLPLMESVAASPAKPVETLSV